MKNFATNPGDLSLPYCEYLDTKEPQMMITQEIGKNPDGSGLDCDLFARTLMTLDQLAKDRGYKRVKIMINSPGGAVEDGMSIYDAICRVEIPVDTYVTGRAASMAGVLFQAGRKRYMMDYSQLMLHNPHGSDNKKQLKAAKDSLVKMLSRHGVKEDKVDALMNKESWILADEALKLGLCDEIEESGNMNNSAPNKELWAQYETTSNLLKKKVA